MSHPTGDGGGERGDCSESLGGSAAIRVLRNMAAATKTHNQGATTTTTTTANATNAGGTAAGLSSLPKPGGGPLEGGRFAAAPQAKVVLKLELDLLGDSTYRLFTDTARGCLLEFLDCIVKDLVTSPANRYNQYKFDSIEKLTWAAQHFLCDAYRLPTASSIAPQVLALAAITAGIEFVGCDTLRADLPEGWHTKLAPSTGLRELWEATRAIVSVYTHPFLLRDRLRPHMEYLQSNPRLLDPSFKTETCGPDDVVSRKEHEATSATTTTSAND
eukprot:GHVU01085436.1.p1 GENE.GHVU01085436.1~~GHVU01085436.1.p1  ORF type:complete len:273 (+),score=57.02 GHVU01085436.1:446-1264(+)